MTARDIIDNYSKVEYLATDGNWHKLSLVYPICLPVADEPEHFFLDTGGQMADCDFFKAKLVGEELHRLHDNGKWAWISQRIRIVDW